MEQDSTGVKPDRSLGDLFAELQKEFSQLVRQELNLARLEVGGIASKVGRDAGLLVTGGLLAYTGLQFLFACVVILLVEGGMPWWGATLLVGGVILALGVWISMRSLGSLRTTNLTPRQTLDSLKEEPQWTHN